MQPSFKTGIGMLIARSRPLALPFYHYGMQDVLPVGAVRPRSGHTVRMVFGETIDCDDGWVAATAARHDATIDDGPGLWRAITEETYAAVSVLEHAVHPGLAPPAVTP
jgi:hypothetical protein